MTAASPYVPYYDNSWDAVYEWLWADRHVAVAQLDRCIAVVYKDGLFLHCGAPVPIGGEDYCTYHSKRRAA